jgi:acyloxyacyl hydrolase
LFPIIDTFKIDRDLFASKHETFRGTWWRGADCSDLDENVYPGRRPLDSDKYFDSNCNKIKGFSSGGDNLEEKYCKAR